MRPLINRDFFSQYHMTEQAGVAVTIYTCIREVFGSKLGRGTVFSERRFSWRSSVPQKNFGVLFRLGHYHFLSNPFQFIIYISSNQLTLFNVDTVRIVK
jgi:hypothetical protein